MKIITHTDTIPQPTVATIGFFDGVHLGHRHLIDDVRTIAAERKLATAVVTFDAHPRQVLQQDFIPQLLSTTDEKLERLAATGVDYCVLLHFDHSLAALSAYDFMRQVLSQRVNAQVLVTGYDNRFGHNRAEGFADYVRYGEEMGMKVLQNTPIDIDGLRVSSSLIRRLLAEGNILEANNCLGHPYSITGSVAHGFQEGRRIGFPTANIVPESAEKLVPGNGVYATRVSVEGGEWMPAMLNIGTNPTFQRQQTTIEAHIIGFEGDIYGRKVRVEFGRKLRDEQRFESVEALQKQLEADKKEVEMVRW